MSIISPSGPADNSNLVLVSVLPGTAEPPPSQRRQAKCRADDEIPPSHNFAPTFNINDVLDIRYFLVLVSISVTAGY
jgi:hypothetical protein